MKKADVRSPGIKFWVGGEEMEVANIDFTSKNVSVNEIYDNLRTSRIRERFVFWGGIGDTWAYLQGRGEKGIIEEVDEVCGWSGFVL